MEWFIESGACPVKCTIVPSKTISPGLRFDKRSFFVYFVYPACPVGKNYRTGVKFMVMRNEADFTGVVQILIVPFPPSLFLTLQDDIKHPLQISLGHGPTRRQAKTSIEQVFGDLPANRSARISLFINLKCQTNNFSI